MTAPASPKRELQASATAHVTVLIFRTIERIAGGLVTPFVLVQEYAFQWLRHYDPEMRAIELHVRRALLRSETRRKARLQ